MGKQNDPCEEERRELDGLPGKLHVLQRRLLLAASSTRSVAAGKQSLAIGKCLEGPRGYVWS
eukprot:757389-Hanusia_phi.AAC.4